MKFISESSFYFRFSEELEDRLDANYNDPTYDLINSLLSRTRYPIVSLGDPKCLEKIVSGKTPRGLHYVNDGVVFIGSTHVSTGSVEINDAPRIPTKIHQTTLASSQIRKGNVLITMAGTIGRCATYNHDEECNANQAIAILHTNQAEIEPEFLATYLNSQIGQLFFHKLQHISSQPNINLEEIKLIKIILPSTKEEQKDIVASTKTIEGEAIKLEAESETIANEAHSMLLSELGINVLKEDLLNYFFKSAEEKTLSFSIMPDVISDRMQYLFFHPKQAVLKKMQEKYTVERLENICVEPIRRGKPSEYDENGEIKIIKTVDLKNTYVDYDNCLKVSRTFVEEFPDEQVKKNDILVSSTGYVSLGKIAVHDRDEIVVVDRHISILRVKTKYDPYFVTYFLDYIWGKFNSRNGFLELQGKLIFGLTT